MQLTVFKRPMMIHPTKATHHFDWRRATLALWLYPPPVWTAIVWMITKQNTKSASQAAFCKLSNAAAQQLHTVQIGGISYLGIKYNQSSPRPVQ